MKQKSKIAMVACIFALVLFSYLYASWYIATTLIAIFAILAFFFEFENTNSKSIALCAALIAMAVVSRQMLHGIGASPFFFIIILTGYVLGATNGFVVGAATMLVSNFFVGGQGPWTPYQMVGAGLVGLCASFIIKTKYHKLTLVQLSIYAIVSAYMYGAITNIFWWLTFVSEHNLTTYLAILAAGFPYDTARALTNFALIAFAATPVIKILVRFRNRFYIEYLS